MVSAGAFAQGAARRFPQPVRVGDLMMELAHQDMAVLLVEHDMDMVMRVCRQIYVLDVERWLD